MSVFVAIPVKTLRESKKRLMKILTPEERQNLTLTMLEDVLRSVMGSSLIQSIVVISSDPKIKQFIKDFDVEYLKEKSRGLNQAVEDVTRWAIREDAKSVLILSSDTPLIKTEDVNKMIKLGSEEKSIVIAPSQNGGTNALLQKPLNLIKPSFGPESFRKHLVEASKKGIIAKIYQSETVSIDIDSPDDLTYLLKIGGQTKSFKLLKEIGLINRL